MEIVDDIWYNNIFYKLPLRTICLLRITSKWGEGLVEKDSIWKKKYEIDFGKPASMFWKYLSTGKCYGVKYGIRRVPPALIPHPIPFKKICGVNIPLFLDVDGVVYTHDSSNWDVLRKLAIPVSVKDIYASDSKNYAIDIHDGLWIIERSGEFRKHHVDIEVKIAVDDYVMDALGNVYTLESEPPEHLGNFANITNCGFMAVGINMEGDAFVLPGLEKIELLDIKLKHGTGDYLIGENGCAYRKRGYQMPEVIKNVAPVKKIEAFWQDVAMLTHANDVVYRSAAFGKPIRVNKNRTAFDVSISTDVIYFLC